MTNREISAPEGTVLALEQLLFQRTFIHPFDEIKRTFAELNRIASIMSRAAIIVAIGIR